MNILDLLFRRKPTKKGTIHGSRHEPPAIAQTMDAGRLSDILRSAEAGDMTNYFSLARDVVAGHGHTLAEFGKRKLAVLGNAQVITPQDDKDRLQVTVAEAVTQHVDDLTSWGPAMVHLLDSTIYPVAVVEKIWKASTRPGWRYELAELRPVPYRLLDYSSGCMRIRDTTEEGSLTGSSHEVIPMRYIVHRGHLLTSTPDTWGGPVRAILFWWLFATQDRDWWARFLERFGAPFLEGTYNKDDDASRFALERAFSAATRLFGIAVPDDASVKIHQANASQGGDAYEKFHAVANREISKIVLGQTLSADAQATGMGSSVGKEQGEVRDDIRQYDAMRLGDTIRTQVLADLVRLNGWGVPTPRISWGGESAQDLSALSLLIERLARAGIVLNDEGLEALNKRSGVTFHRAPAGMTPPALGPLSALSSPDLGEAPAGMSAAARDAVDQLAAAVAPTLSEEMARALQPLAAVVNASTSLSDLEAKLRGVIPSLDLRSAAAVAQGALVASSANAALAARTP